MDLVRSSTILYVVVTVSRIRCTVYCIRRDCRREQGGKILFFQYRYCIYEVGIAMYLPKIARAGALLAQPIRERGSHHCQILSLPSCCLHILNDHGHSDQPLIFHNFLECLAPPDRNPPAFNYALCALGCFRVRTCCNVARATSRGNHRASLPHFTLDITDVGQSHAF